MATGCKVVPIVEVEMVDAFSIESYLLTAMKKYRKAGEWFMLPSGGTKFLYGMLIQLCDTWVERSPEQEYITCTMGIGQVAFYEDNYRKVMRGRLPDNHYIFRAQAMYGYEWEESLEKMEAIEKS